MSAPLHLPIFAGTLVPPQGPVQGPPLERQWGLPGLWSRIPRQMGRLALLARDEPGKPLWVHRRHLALCLDAWAPKSAFAEVQP
jgi:hypothetical protein